jgi:hypothetical protein
MPNNSSVDLHEHWAKRRDTGPFVGCGGGGEKTVKQAIFGLVPLPWLWTPTLHSNLPLNGLVLTALLDEHYAWRIACGNDRGSWKTEFGTPETGSTSIW